MRKVSMFSMSTAEISRDELPVFEQMMQDANGAPASQKYATFLKAAQMGSASLVGVYFDIHESCDHIASDKIRVIEDLVKTPQAFSAPLKTYDALQKHIDMTDGYFGKQSHAFDTMLWNMYAQSPSYEAAKVAATMMADYMRYRILQDTKYKPDFSFLRGDLGTDGLSAEMDKVSKKDSVLTIQHALVDYVANEGPNLPLNRGAAMLPILASDVSAETSSIWSQKMTDFRLRRFEGLTAEIVKVQPIFEVAP